MQEKHLYEYAVVRLVPKVEREEFLNVGIIVFCSARRFLKTKFDININRLQAFSRDVDIAKVEERLMAFQHICEADRASGPIGKFPIASRFRWLTSSRSSVIQTSPVHPGFCRDPAELLDRLFLDLVMV